MNRFPTGHEASFRPAFARSIAVVLLVSALLVSPCLAEGAGRQTTGADSPAGFGFFLGFAPLQVATKAPVNVSTTPVVVASPVRTVQTAVQTVATPVSPVTPQGTAVTPGPTAATTGKVSPIPALSPRIMATFAIATPRPFATTPLAFATPAYGTAATYCLAPTTKCGGTCVDTTTDARNCGYCGQICNADQHCSGRMCVVTCPSGEANLYTDNNNCGQCGYQCGAGKACYNKVCVDNISPDYHDCGNGYVNFNNDYHCGACFHQCPAGSHCRNGTCLLQCGNALVDTDSDPNNCGQCGQTCAYGICCSGHCVNWDEFDANCGECGKACQDGRVCAFGPGWFDCEYHCQLPDGRDYWIYTLNRDTDCGACGVVCSGGTHCVSGRCMQNCAEDSVLCPDNTCVPRSTQNCAFCGNACLPGETCTNGHCVCPEGYKVCDGACVELGTRSHCGVDCQPCPAGYECKKYQQWGTCLQDCPYGYLSCGDGSCKNVQIDRQNCGACGNACAAGQFCINGTCLNSCPAGSMDCQNDGTCDNPSMDPRNCGSCGNSCQNQTDLCVNGVCQYYCNIPAIYENRCFSEAVGGLACSDRRTDPLNCGGCGRYCNLHETCVDGECVESCPQDTQYCDGAGCTNIGYDRNNCGDCGNRCGVMCVWGDCWPW